MTTVGKPNVHALAIEGTFDDCQRIVKDLFGDLGLSRRDEPVGRQFDQLGAHPRPDRLLLRQPRSLSARRTRRVSFAVPTGNFGDILAGYYAKRMGLPIERLVDRDQRERHPRPRAGERPLRAARRQGDAVAVDGHPGLVEFRAPAVRGLRPATPEAVRALMADFAADGSFAIPAGDRSQRIRADFGAERVDEAACAAEMAPRLSRQRRSSSIRTAPSASPPARRALAAAPGDAGRRARHRPSGEVPRRGRSARPACAPRCRRISPISWTARRRSSSCRTIATRSPIISARLRGRRRERSGHNPALRPRRRHRRDAACEDRRGRRLRRRRLAPRERRASTGCRICSNTWRSRARAGEARATSPKRSRTSAATSTPRPASSGPAISPA